jgi:hypothetical protein
VGVIERHITTPPRRVPAVGQVLDLAVGDAQYLDYPVRIRVSRPRPDISLWYGGDWVWVHAEVLGDGDELLNVMPVLVRVDAIPIPPVAKPLPTQRPAH